MQLLFSKLSRKILSPDALLFAALLLLAAAGYLRRQSNNLQEIAVPLSALVAMSGYIFNSAVKLHSETRDKTFELLRSSQLDESLRKHLRTFGNFVRANSILDHSDVFKVILDEQDGDLENSPYQSVIYIGNFFETIWIAKEHGVIYDDILAEYYKGTLKLYVTKGTPFIEAMRNSPPVEGSPFGQLQRAHVFSGVEKLHCFWQQNAK